MDIPLIALSMTFILLIILGCPIAFAMILAFIAYCVVSGTPLTLLPIKLVGAVDSFPLMAVPFFIMAASIMNKVGVTDRLFDFASAVMGHVRGGLAHANILNSMIFAGISGSAVADAAGPGMIEMKAMIDRGYTKEFSAATTAASSVIGPIIPPSIAMVIYSVMTGERITELFSGGIIPGIIMGGSLMAYIALIGKRQNLPKEPRATWRLILRAFSRAFFPLLAPLIIVGSILTGATTPTEGAVVAVAYSLFLGIIYRSLKIKDIIASLKDSVLYTAVCLFMLAASGSYGWAITIKKLPELVFSLMITITQSPTVALLIVVAMLTFLGCIMSADAGLIITVPVLLSIAEGYHINLVYMGVLAVVVLSIGVVTPPVGICIFAVTAIVGIPFERVIRATLPFLIPEYIAVLLFIFFPSVVMFVPNLLFRS
jgi:tripartite ATP-independent transporter DctM subunit